jgi:UPF0176 protein
MKHQILLFYIYRKIENPEILMERERAVWNVLGLTGRMIIAEEGINGTLEGTVEATERYMQHLHADRRFKYLDFKTSEGTGASFPRISIKVRDEIVSTKLPKHIRPDIKTAPRVTAKQLHKMYEKNEDFVVVDMRNTWEIASGKFKNTIDPGMQASRDLPEKIEKIKKEAAGKKIVTVCNGGVRCEKMSAYLLDQGVDNVYQLHNGIHTYMQSYPGVNFDGTLYTFDDRLTMDFTDDRETVGECHRCEKKSENYINCSNDACHLLCIICDDCGGEESIVFCSDKCKDTATHVTPRMMRAKAGQV